MGNISSTYKRKICFLISSHYSHTMGGVETQAKIVIDALNKKNIYEIYYVCRNVDPAFVPEGYKLLKIGNLLGKYFSFFDSWSLYRTLCLIEPDVIYQNGGSSYAGVAAFYAKKFGVHFIWHIASDKNVELPDRHSLKGYLKNSIDQLLVDFGIRNADIILGQNRYQDSILRSRYNRKCDDFIPPGHPLPKHRIDKNNDGKIKVLWIGNLRSLKQPELFVKLAQKYLDRNDIEFIMIGGFIGKPDSYKSVLQEIKATSNLRYLGQVPQETVNAYLSTGHILVNTSIFEGFPNTFVQAWLHKVPVVSLNVDPDGVLVKERIGLHSKTVDRLIEDVAFLASDQKKILEMGQRAKRYAESHHTQIEMVSHLVDLFGVT